MKDKLITTVALYCRVSTEDQAREGTSLLVQRESLEKYAKDRGWKVYYPQPDKIYVDDGYSGNSLERPALKKLMQDAKARKFDVVMVAKLDRFARNNRILLNLIEEFSALDIGFISATESFDTVTAAGKMALSMLGTVAQFERDRIIERVFPGMIKGVEKGNWQGARYYPYGYKYNKELKLLEVVPQEAEVVKLIYTMYLSNQSTSQIAGYLYEKGYKTRSEGKFHSKLVRDILRSKVYLGKLEWNKHTYDKNQKTRNGYKYVKNDPSKVIVTDGRHKAIIAQEEYDLAQKKLEKNRRGTLHRNTPHGYALTGILYCAECFHKFRGAMNTCNSKNNAKKPWYRCAAKQEHNIKCSNSSVQAEIIEPQVFEILDFILQHPEIKEGRIENIVKNKNGLEDSCLNEKLFSLKSKLQKNLEQQKKLNKQSLDGLIADEIYNDHCIDLRKEERDIKKELQTINVMLLEKEQSETYTHLLKRVVENFDTNKLEIDNLEKKELLQLIFKRVLIKDKQITILELYDPFKRYYEEMQCSKKSNLTQEIPMGKVSSYIVKPTAAK